MGEFSTMPLRPTAAVPIWIHHIHPHQIYDSFTEAEQQIYHKVDEQFDTFCAPITNVVTMAHKLLTLKQGRMSIDEYITALHKLARDCNLGNRDQYERMAIQALLLGIESERVRRRLFERQ